MCTLCTCTYLFTGLRSTNEQTTTHAWSNKEYFNKLAMRKISKKSLNLYADYLAPRLIEGFEFDEQPPEWHSDMKKRTIDDWLAEVASPRSMRLDENDFSDTDGIGGGGGGGDADADSDTDNDDDDDDNNDKAVDNANETSTLAYKSPSVAGVTRNSPVPMDDDDDLSQELFTASAAADATASMGAACSGGYSPSYDGQDGENLAQMRDDEMTDESSVVSFSISKSARQFGYVRTCNG